MSIEETAAIETGAGSRNASFPVEWGRAPDDPETRVGWIRAQVRIGEIARDAGEDVPWLRPTGRTLIRRLEAKRNGPAPVAMDPRESWIRRAMALRTRIDNRRRLERIAARRVV